MRDILVPKSKPERLQETLDLLERHYDRVLVHGDPAFADFALTFPAAAEIAGKIRYTGFVVGDLPARLPPSARQDVVLVSAGGGAVGAPLLHAALAARPLTQQRDALWRLITGPNLPETDFAALQKRRRREAAHRALSLRFSAASRVLPRLGLAGRLQHGHGNPRRRRARRGRAVRRRAESEQTLRARLLAERGLVQAVAPPDLTPALLGGGDRCGGGDAGRRPKGSSISRARPATAEILHQALR